MDEDVVASGRVWVVVDGVLGSVIGVVVVCGPGTTEAVATTEALDVGILFL